MTNNKVVTLLATLCASVTLSACVGEAVNTISGTNGAFLMFNDAQTPPSFTLIAGTPTVITVSNVPIDGAVATNITVTPNSLNGVTITNTCPATLANPTTCTITLSLPSGYTMPAINGSLTVDYMAGSKAASANMPVSFP